MKTWILYDYRAMSGNTFDASVIDTTDNPTEVWNCKNGVWFEYDLVDNKLLNERMAEHPVSQEEVGK